MRKAMTSARWVAAASAAAVLLALAGCGEKETGEASASPDVPDVAVKMPTVTANPAFARRDLTFAGNDADGDGRVTSSEYAAAAQRFFGSVDTDDDGALSLAELQAAGSAMAIKDTSLPPKTIAEADNDGDGKLTLAEFIGSVNARFAAIDNNADGALSAAEFQKGFAEVPASSGSAPPAGPGPSPAAR